MTVVIEDYFAAPPEPVWPLLAPAEKVINAELESKKALENTAIAFK